MSYASSLRFGSLSPEAVVRDPLSIEYENRELIARSHSLEAGVRAGSAASVAAASSLNATAARADVGAQAVRALSQSRLALDAETHERAAAIAHSHSALVASTAESDLQQKNADHVAAQSQLATAGALLTAASQHRDAASLRASDKDIQSIAASAQAETANNFRNEVQTFAERQSARATAADAEAATARANERSAEVMAHEASVTASLTKAKAADAELQAAAAERRRADAAALAASTSEAAREAEAKERNASATLRAAEEAAELARAEAVKARADATAREEEAKVIAIQHNNLQIQAAAAGRKAVTEVAHAATAKSRLTNAQRDARIASAEAHHAERDAAIQRAKFQVAAVDADVARGQLEEAEGSLRRSGRVLTAAKDNYLRATSQEATARDMRNHATAHASVERLRKYSEEQALSMAYEREALATTAENTAIRSSLMANSEAQHAAAVHRSAAACRAVHNLSPRAAVVATAGSLSPSRAHAAALLAATSPHGSPSVDLKLRALGSPVVSTPRKSRMY